MDPARTLRILMAFSFVGMLLAAGVYFSGTVGGNTDLDRAAGVVKHMTRASNLERSTFTALYPDARPTDYVEFMFSTAGTAEWPDGEDEADGESKEMHRSARIPLRPAGVDFVPRWPDDDFGQQIVITADNERWVLMVEGYEDPNEAPVTLHEWDFPRLQIDDQQARINQIIAENQEDMGMYSSARRASSGRDFD